MSEDRCVICGAYVPEGRMICPECEKRPMKNLSHGEMVQIAEGKKSRMQQLIDGRFCTPLTFEQSSAKDTCLMCGRPFKDFVKVVRCKDCKWSNDDCSECMNPTLALGGDYTSCLYIEPNWFCADGRRKEKNDAKIR